MAVSAVRIKLISYLLTDVADVVCIRRTVHTWVDHVRPALKQLHWLLVTYRIQYKVALLMYMVHVNRCPQYLRDSVVSASSEPGRHDTIAVRPPT